MRPIVISSCPRNIALLNIFLGDGDSAAELDLEMIDPGRIPAPLRPLLDHRRDMTSTLATFHREAIGLEVLEQRVEDGEVLRHVVLRGRQSGRPVEYGASRIRLAALSAADAADVLEGQEPLGGILNAAGVQFRSCPGGFLRVRPHARIVTALQLSGDSEPEWLFGRCNCLDRAGVGVLAEVVEILPPDVAACQSRPGAEV